MNRRIVITALLAGTAVLAGCKKTPPASLPPDPTPTAISSNPGGASPSISIRTRSRRCQEVSR